MPEAAAVQSMFARIAGRYDLANRWLSGGVDRWWRRRLVRAVLAGNPSEVLDLATGSGDVAFALSRRAPADLRITGMDFCQPMLDEAGRKQAAASPRYANIRFVQGDGLALPAVDGSFDAVTIAFGLRNMTDRLRALGEMRRVLRPGGRVHVLEFSQPYGWFRPLYYAYLRHVLPSIAAVLTGDRGAYEYLCGSVESFPTHTALAEELRAAGFTQVAVTRLTFGIVAIHQGTA